MEVVEEEKISAAKFIIAAFACGLMFGFLAVVSAARTPIAEFLATVTEWELAWIYEWAIRLFIVPTFESPMFLAMPFFGFFAVFFLIDWINSSFKTKMASSPAFPVVFLFLSLGAYFVALYWYLANFASLQGVPLSLDMVTPEFWSRLHGSAFIFFIWSGLFGWGARIAVEKIKL